MKKDDPARDIGYLLGRDKNMATETAIRKMVRALNKERKYRAGQGKLAFDADGDGGAWYDDNACIRCAYIISVPIRKATMEMVRHSIANQE